jgi:hypothetical protein
MRPLRLALGVGLMVAACAPQPRERQPPAGSTTVAPRVAIGAVEAVVDGTPAAALDRARAALEARGFTISTLAGPAGTLEATGRTDAQWASCPTITVRDPFSEALRSRRVQADQVASRVTVTAAAATPATTRVAVRALHLGTYVNSFTGNPQEVACRSSGLVEREVLEAIRAGAG